jgi:hypothetical protein
MKGKGVRFLLDHMRISFKNPHQVPTSPRKEEKGVKSLLDYIRNLTNLICL